jgi:hypothetical protein
MHYDLNTFGLWFGAGLLLIVGGFNQSGWKHRGIVVGMIAVGGLFIAGALLWPFLWPSLAGFMFRAATPATWLVVALLAAAYLLLGPQFKAIESKPIIRPNLRGAHLQSLARGPYDDKIQDLYDRAHSLEQRLSDLAAWTAFNPDSAVPPIGTPELRQQLEAQIGTLRSEFQELADNLHLPPNMGSTLAEVLSTSQDVRLSQIARIRDETSPLIDSAKFANLDLLYVLDWALTRTEVMLVLPDLKSRKPAYDPLMPPPKGYDLTKLREKMGYWQKEVISVLTYLPKAHDLQSALQNATINAEHTLRKMADHEMPRGLGVLEFRDFYVQAIQCEAVSSILDELETEIRNDTLSTMSGLRTRANQRRKKL